MKTILVVVMVSAMACSDGESGPDANLTWGAFDQFSSCDTAWLNNGLAPHLCSHACAVRPIALPSTGNCPSGALCLSNSPCTNAVSPGFNPINCEATFKADGKIGCCIVSNFAGLGPVPQFFACPAS